MEPIVKVEVAVCVLTLGFPLRDRESERCQSQGQKEKNIRKEREVHVCLHNTQFFFLCVR